jgi:hypothetical protein
MQVENIKISRRKTPSGACVEFIGRDGQTIEVELRGEEIADMTDEQIIGRAKMTMGEVSGTADNEIRDEAGLDQTLNTP